MRYRIKHGGFKVTDKQHGRTVLSLAAENGKLDLTAFLTRQCQNNETGFVILPTDGDGRTPLS